jgi:hypothetical protein
VAEAAEVVIGLQIHQRLLVLMVVLEVVVPVSMNLLLEQEPEELQLLIKDMEAVLVVVKAPMQAKN